jgi:hypothetical protein
MRLTATVAQVEWAERIKRRVNGEFDRVGRSFREVAASAHQRRCGKYMQVLP